MSRRKRGRAVNGIVLLDKPAGISSNRALQKVRALFEARKGGHTGTLDPFATGMLPVCLGEASKTAAFMLDADKAYRAVARLGIVTDTGDTEGEPVEECIIPELSTEDVRAAMRSLTGAIEQVPPMYSALKHEGRPLYELAREGKTVERKPRLCLVHEFRLLELKRGSIEFFLRCSKGTYVRTLAEDLARSLGTCAHLVSLRRLAVGPFGEEEMATLEQLESAAAEGTLDHFLHPVDLGLQSWPRVVLAGEKARGFSNGNPQQGSEPGTGKVRVYGPEGKLLGLAEQDADGRIRPLRVFNL